MAPSVLLLPSLPLPALAVMVLGRNHHPEAALATAGWVRTNTTPEGRMPARVCWVLTHSNHTHAHACEDSWRTRWCWPCMWPRSKTWCGGGSNCPSVHRRGRGGMKSASETTTRNRRWCSAHGTRPPSTSPGPFCRSVRPHTQYEKGRVRGRVHACAFVLSSAWMRIRKSHISHTHMRNPTPRSSSRSSSGRCTASA